MKTKIIFLLLFPIVILAQVESEPDTIIMNNTYGISFSFSNFGIEKFEGGIGGKYWFSNDYAVYLSIDVGLRNREHTKFKSEFISGKLAAGIEKHFFVKKVVSPMIGVGINYMDRIDVQKYNELVNPGNLRKYEEIDKSLSLGIFAGVEIFAYKFVSFSANYGLWLEYSGTQINKYYKFGSNEKDKYNYTIFSSTASELIISVYF